MEQRMVNALKRLVSLAIVAALLLPATLAYAAAPDGAGPWADTVVSATQGLRKNGSAVLPARSDPSDALGVAENTASDSTFFSLGFGGQIVLGFDNAICNGEGNDVELVEVTNEPYPNEAVEVYVSQNGSTFVLAGTVTKDGSVSLPTDMPWAKYVKLVDVSDPALFPAEADAYDLDGVKALSGGTCSVAIDIKPGSFPNSINLGSDGTVPVAILSTQYFDATQVDPSTIAFAGATVATNPKGKLMASFEDVNGDSLFDLVVHFNAEALALVPGDTEATLTGTTFDGVSIAGTDSVRFVPES